MEAEEILARARAYPSDTFGAHEVLIVAESLAAEAERARADHFALEINLQSMTKAADRFHEERDAARADLGKARELLGRWVLSLRKDQERRLIDETNLFLEDQDHGR